MRSNCDDKIIAETDGHGLEAARKIVQNFERCLNTVKPKLVVLESTHGKDIKRVGFENPETLFGTPRSVVSKKMERALIRREKRQVRPLKRRHVGSEDTDGARADSPGHYEDEELADGEDIIICVREDF